MDKNLPIDFIFGDKYRDVKKMDYSLLSNHVEEVKNIYLPLKPLYYQKNTIKNLWKDYGVYLLLGDVTCVSTWMFLFFSKFSKKSVYLWSHGWYGKETLLKKILKKAFFAMAKGIFLYGNYAKQLMIEEGINGSKLHVIYNSLNYDVQIGYRNELEKNSIYNDHFKNSNKNLVFIGRLTPIKKLDLLLYALKELNTLNHNYNLTFIGDGEKRHELQKLTDSLGLSKLVWFYGACYSEKEISNLIYNADLCVSPGNVGLTAMHSMVYGTPVLTHNKFEFQMPEFEAIRDGKTGTYFKYGDYISLASNIIRWFEEKHDRNNIRKACYEVIDEFYNPHIQLNILKNYLK